jgi:hypothetical protein
MVEIKDGPLARRESELENGKEPRKFYRRAQGRFIAHPGNRGCHLDKCVCCDCSNGFDRLLKDNEDWIRVKDIEIELNAEGPVAFKTGDSSKLTSLMKEKERLLAKIYDISVEYYEKRKAEVAEANKGKEVSSWM